MAKQINTIEELKKLATDKLLECYILLNGGMRSSKDIEYNSESNTWTILHSIDGSFEEVTDEEFKTQLIYQAIPKGALFVYEFQP